jgi:hypothetical protein
MRVSALIAGLFAFFLPLVAKGQAVSPGSCKLQSPDLREAGASCAASWFDAHLRINEIQTVGTAESYKLRPSREMLSLIGMGSNADRNALNFALPPIASQLDENARSLQFDVSYDPKGGLFKHPAGASMASQLMLDDYLAAMSAPGFKVIHVLDVDFNSSCLTLVTCLQKVAKWSRRHSTHVPITIIIRTNDTRTPMPGATRPLLFDRGAFDALEREILSVFQRHELITPDIVQASYPTLGKAVAAYNWPKLGQSRGRVLFVLDDTPEKTGLYLGSPGSRQQRIMFITTDEQSPFAAFISIPDPVRNAERIIKDVRAGLMVITRADSESSEARSGSTLRRDWALASGAQIILTNFIRADSSLGTYRVGLSSGRPAQCNVQIALERCGGFELGQENSATSGN